ncbi:MAG: rhodanese-like domain-containing protein, partial [Burkholderiales bacterium]|nr:rhodanese-like domain-containing protein [Burkholderiales bacterium]
VYNVLDGFEGPLDDRHHRGAKSGWRFEGLPWEQL